MKPVELTMIKMPTEQVEKVIEQIQIVIGETATEQTNTVNTATKTCKTCHSRNSYALVTTVHNQHDKNCIPFQR